MISWRKQKSLKKITESLLDGILTESIIEYFQYNRPRYFVSDNSSWFRDAVYNVHEIYIEDPFEYLAQKIKENVKFLRAYHGCKPIDFKSYFENGIIPLDTKTFVEYAETRLTPCGVTKADIINGMKGIDTSCRGGYAWFVLDDRSYFEGCEHYLIYGSEYLNAVAGKIQYEIGKPAKYHLEEVGTPTIFVCNIPISIIDDVDLRLLSGTMIKNYFEIIFDGRDNSDGLNFGFEIEVILKPEYIIDHYHPKELNNQFLGGIPYRPKITKCEYCK